MYRVQVRLLLMSLAMLLRWGVSLWPHSGQAAPPLHGDYEAQRHWQEITVNLPVGDWYTNTSDNDLQYWGLDYPPLTAYHSLALGLIARSINSSWVELHTSRGLETEGHKLFMRLTVVAADLVSFLPAAFLFSSPGYLTTISLLASPSLIIIDHGHFQYNNVSLGFFLAAVSSLLTGRHCLGSFLFVCALNYKQIELYHALPFFCFLLGLCLQQRPRTAGLAKLITISFTVIATFAAIWAPWLAAGPASVLQLLHRIFPFSRGLFEDKVANFWCALDVLLKLKQRMTIPQLAQLSLASTLVLALPSNLYLLARPTAENFLFSLTNTSLVFFLFSFQVHEKSILLAVTAGCLLTSCTGLDRAVTRTAVPWLAAIAMFSMQPLLLRDGLAIPALALTVFYLVLVSNQEGLAGLVLEQGRTPRTKSPLPLPPTSPTQRRMEWCRAVSLVGCLVLHTASIAIPPPAHLPFLWPLLVCVYSAAHLVLATVYLHLVQFTRPADLHIDKKQQ